MRTPISEQSARDMYAEIGIYTIADAMPVIVDGRKYCSVKSAARSLGVSGTSIVRAINQGRKCKGHTVRYADEW